MTLRLREKVALVFGAGSSGPGWGNGKAVAVLFARQGAKVIAVDRSREAAEETGRIIREEGNACEVMEADVTSGAAVTAVVEATLARYGQIDILHNNVGLAERADLLEMDEADWQRGLDVNATSVFLTCKSVLPAMLQRRQGAIVNVSSLASIQVNSYPYFAYYAAKSAINQFTRALAVHYAAQGIRANAILPGVLNTPLIHQQISSHFADTESMMKARNAASPMGRMGDAWDVAYAALFLASDEAKYITGVCLPVDGGKSCAGR
jgi:NAD(P)-dependent dehydrogenase (short-subunit alcohol dehydrogenase family)